MGLLSYLKTIWANNTDPAINDANLNKIEGQLEDLTTQGNDNYTQGQDNLNAIGTLNSRVSNIIADSTDNVEVIDARTNTPYNATYTVLKDNIDAVAEETLIPKQLGGGYLINGDMQVWQRGTSFNPAVNGIYTADRKNILNITDDNVRVIQAPGVIDGFQFSARIEQINAIGALATATRYREQIEKFEIFKGKKVQFTSRVKIDVGKVVRLIVEDGVGFIIGSDITGDGTVKELNVEFDVDTNATLLVVSIELVRVGIAVGEGMNVQTMKLEIGDKATEFIPKTFAEELRDCQRYYETSYDYGVLPGTPSAFSGAIVDILGLSSIPANQFYNAVQFKAPKRIPPTVQLYGFSGTINTVSSVATGTDLATNSGIVAQVGQNSFYSTNASGGALGVVGNGISYHFVADAEL